MSEIKKFYAATPEEMATAAPAIIEAFGDRRVIAMDAPMGAGKTTLVRVLCKAMGVDDVVNSPTFAIINDYARPDSGAIYHFDLYRLRNISEAYNMGFEEYFYSGNYCFIEWPSIAEEIFPDNRCILRIKVMDNGTREIEIE